MDRYVVASGLLRDLWRIYDHGGHSMGRSARSSLLETDWPYGHKLLKGVRRNSFYDFAKEPPELTPLPNQRHVLNAVPNLRWEWKCKGNRLLMLAALTQVYASMEEPSLLEMKILHAACVYAGLPSDGGIYLEAVKEISLEKLISLLKNEDPVHKELLKEFGMDS